MVAATRTSSAWERYAWVAGILYVIALVAETVVGLLGGGLSQNASAAKIANTLYDHRGRLLVVTLDRPGDLGGSDPWKDAESCLHSGSTPMSCANAR